MSFSRNISAPVRILGRKIKKNFYYVKNNQEWKDKLHTVIFGTTTPAGKLFDVILIGLIIFSILITILESVEWFRVHLHTVFFVMEWVTTLFFTAEYLLRLYCSHHPKKYAFSFFGIVDLLATLPLYLMFFITSAQYLIVLRAFRLIRVFRVFKLFSFLSEGQQLVESIIASGRKLFAFFSFVFILTIAIGTIMYMVEGDVPGSEFNNIPNSIYWAIVTLTTVGYGDITPVTGIGKLLSGIVMLLGYTIIAVPTGIVSVAMFKTVNGKKVIECPNCHTTDHTKDDNYCRHCGTPLFVKEKKDEMSEEDVADKNSESVNNEEE